MASVTRSPGAAASDTSVGTRTWSSHASVLLSDDTRASAQSVASGQITHYLKTSGYGFAIPSGATINGIEVNLEGRATVAGNATVDHRARVVKAGVIQATELASAVVWPGPSVDGIRTYGGPTSLPDGPWAPADVNDAGFGFAISATNSNVSASQAQVDHLPITVYYTDVPATPVSASDTGVLAESATVVAVTPLSAADAGSGAEQPSALGLAGPAESWSAVDDAVEVELVAVAPDGVLTESATVAVPVSGADLGAASEGRAVGLGGPADSATVAEAASLVIDVVLPVLARPLTLERVDGFARAEPI